MQCKQVEKTARCNKSGKNIVQPHRPRQTCANCLSIDKICYVATILVAAHHNLLRYPSGGSSSNSLGQGRYHLLSQPNRPVPRPKFGYMHTPKRDGSPAKQSTDQHPPKAVIGKLFLLLTERVLR
jgi:hypothetical protein